MPTVRIQPRYTEVLLNLMENEQTRTLLNQSLSTYPLYVSTSQHEYGIPNIIPTREQLNKKILDYYKYREIGFETVGRFLDELEISMNEIMPYYNQLFFSADQDYNIIYNVDYRKTIDREIEGTNNVVNSSQSSNTNIAESEGTSKVTDSSSNNSQTNTTSNTSSETNNKNVFSDTPQNQLSISNVNIDSVDYATNATWDKQNETQTAGSTGASIGSSSGLTESETGGKVTTTDTGSTSGGSQGTNTGSESILETTKGNFGVVSAQDLIIKYREIIINIEQKIINDPRIVELFMLVY